MEALEGRALLAVDWISLGPSPAQNGQVENITDKEVVGAVHTVLAHPTNPDILFVGATNGGIWKTHNATTASPTWIPLTDGMRSLSIGTLAFDPTDPTLQTVVAGIGRYSSYAQVGGSRLGLLRTADSGATWSPLDGGGTLVGKNISGVAARGNTIVVSVNVADSFTFGNVGIFRSTDGGATFGRISTGGSSGLPEGWSFDLAADPTNNAVLYTSIVTSGVGNGVYKSLDTGATWTKVSSPAIDALINANVSNLEISVGAFNNVYIGIVQNGNPTGFFRSGNGGTTWTQMDAPKTNENGTDVGLNPRGVKGPGPDSPPEEIAGGQGNIHFSIVVDPTDANIVYVGGDRQPTSNGDRGTFPNSIGALDYSGRLFRGDASRPAGSQWVHLTHSRTLGAAGGGTASSSSPHADSRDMTFDAAGNLIEVDDGGIYRRTSPRTNTGDWLSLNGSLRVTEMHDVAYDAISNIVMSGNQDTGTTEQIASGGTAWRSVSTGDGGDVAVDIVTLASNSQSIRYSSFQNLGSFRKRIVDASNNVLSTTFPALTVTGGGAALVRQFKTPVELNAITPSRMIIVGRNSIYESSDQGNTIVEVGPNMGAAVFDQDAVAYGGLKNGVANPDALYVGIADKLRIRTTAGGTLSLSDPNPSSTSTIRDVVMTAVDWATSFVIDDSRVYRTADAGVSWADVTGNLTSLAGGFIRTIEYIPGSVGALVVGGSLGVFRCLENSLGTWTEVGGSLPNAPVWDLAYDAKDDVLVAATMGRGAWMVTRASDLTTDVPLPDMTISDASVVEGNAGTSTVTLTVSLSAAAATAIGVSYTTVDGTATLANGDFGSAAGTLSFAAGETQKTISVQVNGDNAVESDESFIVRLSNVSGARIVKSDATVTIVNDDAAVPTTLAIAATDAVRTEGSSGATPFTFTVTRSGNLSVPSSATWAVSGTGSAPANAQDFPTGALPSGTVSFAVGETAKVITVNVAGDALEELDESFLVSLSSVVNASLDTAAAQGLILNDDVAVSVLSIAATDASKAEGNGGSTTFTFTVTRTGSVSGTTQVEWIVTGSGANPAIAADFLDGVLPNGTLVFAVGEASKTITLAINADTLVEADEMFVVTLSNVTGGTLGTAIASGTIRNDDIDAALQILAASASKAEGNSSATNFTFTVTRSLMTNGTTSVSWSVQGAGAFPASAADFSGAALPAGMLTFGFGETTKTVTVPVAGDVGVEPDETFVVVLSDAVGGHLTTASAAGTIVNDDTGLSLAATPLRRFEGNSGTAPATPFMFTVTRQGLLAGASSAQWIVRGSGASPADANDFAGASFPTGTVTFAPGEASQTITVLVNGDATFEADESFVVTLSNASGAQIIEASATGVILQDDIVLVVASLTPSAVEGNAGSVAYDFVVTRQEAGSSLNVDWRTEGFGPLQADTADFFDGVMPAGTLTFAAGETSKTITVLVAGDTKWEFDERFAITLVGDRIRPAYASAVIGNDDVGLTVKNATGTRAEGNSGTTPFSFTVVRSGLLTGPTTASWSVSGSGIYAADASDFEGGILPSGIVSFGIGEASKTITFNVAGDIVLEQNEGFAVTLADAHGADITVATATGIILNDEASLQIAASSATKMEGNTGTTWFSFVITRLNATSGSATVRWTVTGSSDSPADAADFAGGILPSGTVTFAGGETSKQVTVGVVGDRLIESNEAFTLTLSDPANASILTATATGTILSDDTTVTISADDSVRAEGDSGATRLAFLVTRSGGLGYATSVNWAVGLPTIGVPAVNGADFIGGVLPTGTMTFAIGETSKTIHVFVNGDLDPESDESLVVKLTSAGTAQIINATAAGQILSDDVRLAIGPSTVTTIEGNAGTTSCLFTVTRTGQLARESTVTWSVSGTGAAAADAFDFGGAVLPSGTVSFTAGQAVQTISIPIAGDRTMEFEERFAVALSAPMNGTLATAMSTGIGVIRNDDTSVSISPVGIAKEEGHNGTTAYTFTVFRSGVTSGATSLDWLVLGTSGNSADAADFSGGVLPSGRIVFAAGQTSAKITIHVLADRTFEANETFSVQLGNIVGAEAINTSAVGTIVNDDGLLQLTPTQLAFASFGTSASTPGKKLAPKLA